MELRYYLSTIIIFSLIVTSKANRAPYFMNVWSWVIKEDAPIGSRPASAFSSRNEITLRATDPERSPLRYGVKGYIGERYFTVDERSGVVKIRRQFDYEVDTKYTAKFFATDGINEAVREAEITILDVNDNAPIFHRYPFEVNVTEDTHVGAEIVKANASDPDTGAGGAIKYYLENVPNLPVSLNQDTGALRLTKRLDFEKTQVYQFKVIAMDKDRNPLSSFVPVIIRVVDVQDTNPVFLGLPYDISIPENSTWRSTILKLRARDGDTQNPSDVIYSIVSGNEAGDFMLVRGNLRIATPDLNRDIEGFNGIYTLTVRAIEERTRAFTDTTFDITITDVNDEKPVWSQKKHLATVLEDTPTGTKLLTMSVKDLDQGINSEMAIFVDSAHAASFAVTPTLFRGSSTVSLILIKPLDYEDTKRIQLKVFANETQESSHFAVTEVIIDVENVNDNLPFFQKSVYNVNVAENAMKHSTIFQIQAEDLDEGEFGKLSYVIKDTSRKFGIDSSTGEILLRGKIDREEVAQYQILVLASDHGPSPNHATASVTIHITDVNDNIPQFDSISYAAYVNENEEIETPIATVRAFDIDAHPNNKITYNITSDRFSQYFTIKKTEEHIGEIYLRGSLDYERIKQGIIKLQIVATDSGDPPQNSTVPLVVTISDMNDNRPEFTADSTFNITINENLGGGVKIGQVRAIDRDSGKNKKIRYFVEEGKDEFENVFRLNKFSGDITIKPGSSPDYEKIPIYDVTIVAEDHGTPVLSAKRRLLITLIDINDNAPIFEQEKYHVTSLEGTVAQKTVALNGGVVPQSHAKALVCATATDADQGINGDIRYSISQGNTDATFTIDSSSGCIFASKSLDYESTNGEYKFIVTATDQAEEDRLSSTAEVFVTVIDINDNAPVFEISDPERSMIYEVIEGLEGPRVARFTATDADSDENGFITYTLCNGNEEGLFTISYTSGELRVSSGQKLDRETDEFHNLTICATDAGSPPLNATLEISIKVLDTNDNAPQFTEFWSSVEISENANVGDVVTKVLATDTDLAEFGKVFYEISGGENPDTFYMDKWTGVIRLAKALDRETISEYDLEISAKDNPGFPMNSRQTIREMKITVTDINDKTPRFIGKTPYLAQVDENSKPGTIIEVLGDPILAIDEDIGENAIVTYTIVSDDVTFINNYIGSHMTSFFEINSGTAEITIQAELDREALASDTVTLVIRASDRGRRHSDVNVVVKINDTNDNAPRFRSRSVRVRVKEDKKQGYLVSKVIATDRDTGPNAKVNYRIESGAFGKFVVDKESGEITIAPGQLLDREVKDVYNVIIIAFDNGITMSQSSSCSVIIEIDDVNDSRPEFLNLNSDVQIKENSAIGPIVTQLEATDPDTSPQLQYNIISFEAFDNDGRLIESRHGRKKTRNNVSRIIKSWFLLNETTGAISISGSKSHSIDRELCSQVQITISVKDLNSVNEEYSEALQFARVTITIEDENDNAPVFVMSSSDGDVIELNNEFIVDITEERVVGSVLVNLKATDNDFEGNGKIIYEIVDGSSNVQLKDQDSGTLVVASRIDRESLETSSGSAWINVTVVAKDQGSPESKSTKLNVAMKVKDINDNDPMFEKKEYKVSIHENMTVRSEIVAIKATDPDSGDFGTVIYSLKGGRDLFDIHPISGVVQLLSPLDREMTSLYTMVVIATDNEHGAEYDRRESRVKLIINVMDINDSPPRFIEPLTSQKKIVPENSRVGYLVAVVTAIDPDEGAGAEITYSLSKSRISNFFNIQPSSGHITIKKSLTALPRRLDHPKIVVLATDGGGISSNTTIYLDILDVNDHAPLFKNPEGVEMSIYEEEPAGHTVGQITAEDKDSGLNGIVRYSICDATNSDAKNSFFIDEVTGRIITAKKLDRELVAEYKLQICATDQGSEPLGSFASITVKLLDRNDHKPQFSNANEIENGGGTQQNLKVSEDARVGETIGHVTKATDRDIGANAYIYYHLVSVMDSSGISDPTVFSVHKKSRKIILEKSLDRERINEYKLMIKATNDENYIRPVPMLEGKEKKDAQVVKRSLNLEKNSNSTMSSGLLAVSKAPDDVIKMMSLASQYDPSHDPSLITVVITIDDVNDQWPIFEKDKYVSAVEIDAKQGTGLLKVKATDKDIGNNSILTYTITNTLLRSHDNKTEQAVFGVFKIHPLEGTITTSTLLKDYKNGYFKLDIEARDRADHYATSTVYIYILQTSEQIKFIINSPPSMVKEKKIQLAEVLGNITLSRVIVDNIYYHLMSSGRRDLKRSDVTIRVFEQQNMKQYSSETLHQKLEKNKGKLDKLFGNCAVSKNDVTTEVEDDDIATLRIVVIIMLFFLLLIILVFLVLYCHLQRSMTGDSQYELRRRYKRELEELESELLVQHEMKVTSRHDGGNVYSETGTNTILKEEYFSPIPVSRGISKSGSIVSSLKPRSKSENDKLKEKALPRTSTDICVPPGKKPPVPSESFQLAMIERSRKKREKKAKRESTHAEPQQSTSIQRSSLTQDKVEDNRTEEIDSGDYKIKEKRRPRKERKSSAIRERNSTELHLHSGGNSDDIIRKQSISLHGSDDSEQLSLNNDDDSDITPTNMTSSSQSQMTSSVTSVNLISDL